MRMRLGWLTFFVLGVSSVTAAPVLLLPNELSLPGHGEFRLSYWSAEYNKLHNGSGSPADLAVGETRRQTYLPLMARYTFPGGEEILMRSAYTDLSHKTSTGAYSRTGFGDSLIMARSQANLWGDLRGALGIGLNIPTGRGLAEVGANESPTGDGAWEGAASFAWNDSRSTTVFHAEVTYFLRFPRAYSKVMNQALTDEVRFGFSHRVQGGIGVEIKVSDALTLFGEMLGKLAWEQAGTYAATGANANAEVNAKASPEFGVQYQEALWFAPLLQIQASPNFTISGGAIFPLRLTNGYSGTTYLGQAAFKF